MFLRLLVVILVITLTSCQTVQTLPNSDSSLLAKCFLVRELSDSGQYSGSYSLQCANVKLIISEKQTSLTLTMKTNVDVECVISLYSTSSQQIFEQSLLVQTNNQKHSQTRQVELALGDKISKELASVSLLQVRITPQANGQVIITELNLENSSNGVQEEPRRKTKGTRKLISNYIPKLMIDQFLTESNPFFLVVNGNLPLVGNVSISDSFALGGGRKIFLAVESGSDNDYISSEVLQNSWSTSSPETCSGFASVVYDGNSRNVFVNPTGLGCIDLTDSGANAFEIDATSTVDTRFKLSVFSGDSQSTISFTVDSQQGSYLVLFDDLQGNANLQCIGAIQLIASIPSFSEVRVSAITVGGYHPSPSATPTPTPSKSYMVLSGPTIVPPPPHWGSQCAVNSDCEHYETICSFSSCDNGICVNAPRSVVGCCSEPGDCPTQEGCESICVDSYCEYSNCDSESLIQHVQPHPNPSNNTADTEADGSIGWIIGVIVGGIGTVLFVGVVVMFCVVVLVKRRNPSAQRIYNDMLG